MDVLHAISAVNRLDDRLERNDGSGGGVGRGGGGVGACRQCYRCKKLKIWIKGVLLHGNYDGRNLNVGQELRILHRLSV